MVTTLRQAETIAENGGSKKNVIMALHFVERYVQSSATAERLFGTLMIVYGAGARAHKQGACSLASSSRRGDAKASHAIYWILSLKSTGHKFLASNKTSADYYLRRAATLGDPSAMFNLYLDLRYKKSSTARNYAKKLLLLSARKKYPEAMTNLGFHYEMGDLVRRSLTKAKFWYERAAQAGDKLGANNLKRIGKNGVRNLTKPKQFSKQ